MPKRRKTEPELVELADLRRRFSTALAEAGLSLTKWSVENGWTRTHVVATLAAEREAQPTLERVRSFVAEWEAVIAARLAQQSAAA